MGLHDLPDDGQAEAGVPVASPAPEPVEDPALVLACDSWAVVGDRDPQPSLATPGADRDHLARRRQPDRVGQQVADRAPQAVVVTDHAEGIADPIGQPEPLLRCQQRELLPRFPGDRTEVHVRVHQGRRVPAGGRQQVLHQPGHPVGRPVDHLDGPRPLGFARLGGLQRSVEVRTDHRQRCAQFVGGVVDEPALRAERVVQTVEHGVDGVGQFP
ncbi:hypothetical protein KIPE111705_30710 [Kibdelosporangium persicum]